MRDVRGIDTWVWTGVWEGCILVGGRIDAAKKQSQQFSSTRSDLIIRLGYLIAENMVSPAHRSCGQAA